MRLLDIVDDMINKGDACSLGFGYVADAGLAGDRRLKEMYVSYPGRCKLTGMRGHISIHI